MFLKEVIIQANQIADKIDLGLGNAHTTEDKWHFLSPDTEAQDKFIACALGMAAINSLAADKIKQTYEEWTHRRTSNFILFAAMELNIPHSVCRRISNFHCSGNLTAAEIAQELRRDPLPFYQGENVVVEYNVKDILPNMKVDLASCPYLKDEILVEFEYGRVSSNDECEGGRLLEYSNVSTCAYPSDTILHVAVDEEFAKEFPEEHKKLLIK